MSLVVMQFYKDKSKLGVQKLMTARMPPLRP